MRLPTTIDKRVSAWLMLATLLLGIRTPALADGEYITNPFPISGAFQAKHVEDRNHISVIEFTGNYNKKLDSGQINVEPRSVIAREFLRTHPDHYDFIVTFSTFEFDTGDALAFHWGLKNAVKGIGVPEFDVTSLFGSQGKLQGFIDMAALSRYATDPLDPKFETALTTLAHEMLHQWGIRVRFKQGDVTSSDLLGRDGAHWSFLLNSDASVEYGNQWRDNGDGTFTSTATRKFFSPLDLYLMGFYKPEEVPPFFLIENPQIDKTRLPEENVTISGARRAVTIDDVIAAEGPRIPPAAEAQKDFRLAFVLLTAPGERPPVATVTAINNIRNAFMTRFAVMTGGRAVAQVFPEAIPTEHTGTPVVVGGGDPRTGQANLEDGLAWLRGRQSAQGYWTDKDTTRLRDTVIALRTLAQMDSVFTGTPQALQWLNGQDAGNTDYLARHAATLAQLSGNTSALRARLLPLQNSDGGWGIASGYQSSPLDTALAVLALAGYADVSATVLDKAKQYLLASQTTDGGWSNAEGGAARTNVTATVLQALKALNSKDAAVAKALAFLVSKQNSDGGFGDSPSTVHDTANVLQAFMALEALAEIRAGDASGYLLTRQTQDGSWDGSVYATALAVAALKRFNFSNWALTAFSAAPTNPNDGERVSLSITVTNDANLITPAGKVRVYDGDPASGGTPIGADIALPPLAPGGAVTINPLWDTLNKAGPHALVVVVDPDDQQTELSERDNRASVNITVQAAPIQSDLALATIDITITPPQPNTLPTTLGISAGVRNLGLTDANNVRILLWSGPVGSGILIGETTVSILGRSTVVVNFSSVLTKPGVSTFTVQVDPDNLIVEVTKVNNTAVASVATAPSIDLEVQNSDITIDKNPAFIGGDVNFTVRLRNRGTVDTPQTQVRYTVTDGSTTIVLRTNDISIPAGQTIEQTIPWRVDRGGNLTFSAQLDPAGAVPEINEANNTGSLSVTAGAASGANPAVSFKELTFAPDPALEGQGVAVSALVRNTGSAPATDVEIAFYDGDPAGGKQIGSTQVIPTLPAGGSATVSVTSQPLAGSADRLIFVVVDPQNKIAEFSEDDNSAFNVLSVVSLPELAVSAGNIQITPAAPKTGDTVMVTVRVENLGQQSAANALVRAFAGDPASGGTPIGGDQTIPLITGNGLVNVNFTWTLNSTGVHTLFVQVDPANAILERNKANNSAQRDVIVQDGNLFVTNVYFSPDNDGIKDTTQFSFRLAASTSVSVAVVNKRNKVVRRFNGTQFTNTSAGNVIWDGLDDLGRLVSDGPYQLRVLDLNGISLGEVTVHLDTNRSSLFEAVGTKSELILNLTCEIPGLLSYGLLLTSDDSTTFFATNSFNPLPSFPKGIYRMSGNGGDVQTIVPESSIGGIGQPFPFVDSLTVSDDGSILGFILFNFSSNEFRVISGEGKNPRRLLLPAGYEETVPITMTPDGRFLITIGFNNAEFQARLLALPTDGSPARIFSTNNFDLPWQAVSPDSKNVFYFDDSFVPSIANIDSVTSTRLAGLGNVSSSDSRDSFVQHAWSPNSAFLAIADQDNRRIALFDPSGNLTRSLPIPVSVQADEQLELVYPVWAGNSSELAVRVQVRIPGNRFDPDNTETRSGIYRVDLAASDFERVAKLPDQELVEPASYHVSTWNGSRWQERGALHYGMQYTEQRLDLSRYLPDPQGEYKVRIRQQGMEAAHVESVALAMSNLRLRPSSARLLKSGQDVLAKVLENDHEVLDLFSAEMEARWNTVPRGRISLVLNAREEELSKRKTIPFTYPAEPGGVYHYLLKTDTPIVVDGQLTAQDGLGEPLFKVLSKPGTGHPIANVYGYVKSDDKFLYGALDFTVDNTLDGDKDWAALRIKTADGWKDFRVSTVEKDFGAVGFIHTDKVNYTHKYYEFKIPLASIGASVGDTLDLAFQAYGTAAIVTDTPDGLPGGGVLYWMPGERSLLYTTSFPGKAWGILLDEDNAIKPILDNFNAEFSRLYVSSTGRKLFFDSERDSLNPAGFCFQQGAPDVYSYQSLLNLTADLRAIRSATAGGIQLKGTATDLHFASYALEYSTAAAPNSWLPIAPASDQPVIDGLFTTWVPPVPGRYFVRLTVEDLAGNQRRVIKRVSWGDTPSITDLFRMPAIISPNGDGVKDTTTIHYRVLEPVHLEFNFYNKQGERVRTITRDHSLTGIEVDVPWDGRDDRGVPVPDGEYRMVVQNYEFFITVDATSPVATLTLRNAYQREFDNDTRTIVVAVKPSLEWKATDLNLTSSAAEAGEGANPAQFVELKGGACGVGDPLLLCAPLPLKDFVNHRFRVTAEDIAGNKTSLLSAFGAEELIVNGIGNLKVPFVPMTDDSGGAVPVALPFGKVGLDFAETIRGRLLQLSVQFRPVLDKNWLESPVTRFADASGGENSELPNERGSAIWDMQGVEGGKTYAVRLHGVDADGNSHYSNTFKLMTSTLVFLGFADPPKNSEGEYLFIGVETIAEPLVEVALFINSKDDPRYATDRKVGSVAFPNGEFSYKTRELQACKKYSGYLIGHTEPHVDPVTGSTVSRTFRSETRSFSVPCLSLDVSAKVEPAEACDAPSKQRIDILFHPVSEDGSELKLLTLSRVDAVTGEDVVFNVNKPESRRDYSFSLNTGGLPEGPYPLTARLLNVNNEVLSIPLTFKIDHTPPTLSLGSPVEGQRLCGIPKQWADGSPHSMVPIEGAIDDVGGFHYKVEVAPGIDGTAFNEVHDSRSLDSIKAAEGGLGKIDPPKQDFLLKHQVGMLAALLDQHGDLTMRLRVFDAGGFQRCAVRTFSVDGKAEVSSIESNRGLFSPNADGILDDVTFSYNADEPLTVDIDIVPAVRNNATGEIAIVGSAVRKLENHRSVLTGTSESVWDGRDDAGSVVADSWYGIVLSFKDGCGNIAKRTLFVEVDATPPALAIAYPKTGDPLPLVVEVLGSVNDPHLAGYSVDAGVGPSPETWAHLASGNRNTNDAILAKWNTFGADGPYTLRLLARDTVGNEREIQVPLVLAVRTNLISYLEAAPDLFSPNDDGKQDTTSLRFGLEQETRVTANILGADGALVRTLASDRPLAVGAAALAWDGKNNSGQPVADGNYTVQMIAALASNINVKQEEKVTVILDRTAPAIEITRPSDGFVRANGGIVGTIVDLHMKEYTVALTTTVPAPMSTTINTGTDSRSAFTFGSLQDLAEGEYAIKIDAKDQGETSAQKIIPFIIDNTPPKAGITAPENNGLFGVKKGPIKITGTLEEKYLKEFKINVGAGAAPGNWTPIANGTSLPLPSVLAQIDPGTLADGLYTVQFLAEDKAGAAGESRIALTIDNTAPAAGITLPAEGAYVTKPADINGAADDINFAEYVLAVAPGAKGTSDRWSEIGRGAQAVNNGKLLSWQALPPDGSYTLRLSVKDKADNQSDALVQITVDTQPPSAPQGLKATVDNRKDGHLTWAANSESDLAGYAIYRDGTRVNAALVTTPEYIDTNLLTGRHAYVVTAFDRAGLESEKSQTVELVIDVTPPAVKIQTPANSGVASGLVDIKGTAFSADDFKEYRLFVGSGATPSSYQLLRRSPVPIQGDVLGQWNTVVLAESAQFSLKLEAEDINGNVGADQVTVTIDNLPPGAPTGLAATVTGSTVKLHWNANTEADLLGYLVFRNERLANQTGISVGDLRPFAVLTAAYQDLALTDGKYIYTIVAIDKAGNLSDASQPAGVTIDVRPPHAVIAAPADGGKFDRSLYILATTPDTDIAQVQFQQKAASDTVWKNIGAPDANAPYEITWDPAGLPYANYQLRAVATDNGNKTDPAPTAITVTYTDLTKPAPTVGLQTRVTGADVELTWTANTESDLAGYFIDRTYPDGATIRLTGTPVTATTYIDVGLNDGAYRYSIVAVDTFGNQAGASIARTATVYTPTLSQPYTPTLQTSINLAGAGIGLAQVSGEVTTAVGVIALPPVDADAQGQFTLPNLPLQPGSNAFTLRLTDADGNVSKSASITVISATAPAVPTGLTATAETFNVAVRWNANPEPNVLGYRVFRTGAAVLPDARIVVMNVDATSFASPNFPGNAVDDFNFSFWSPKTDSETPAAGQSIVLSWPEPKIVTQADVHWWAEEFRAIDYDLEAWDGRAWITVAEVRGNDRFDNSIRLAQAYRTTTLRLVLKRANSPDDLFAGVRLAEITLTEAPYFTATSAIDGVVDGKYSYTVSALNEFGFESGRSQPAQVAFGDVTPPEAVTLSAAVFGSDVQLNWSASASDDVARYRIYRDGAFIREHKDLTNLQATDAARPNGAYSYIVTAVDAVGNESAPSNAATVLVSIAPPPAPINLTIAAVSTGKALDLSWQSSGAAAPAGYRVLRATTAGGPYTALPPQTGTGLRDSGLANGTMYFYVVVALDAADNASAYSNEASGTPRDLVIEMPNLYFPVIPGGTFTTRQGFSTIVGSSEPGATVFVARNGTAIAQALAATEKQTLVAAGTPPISDQFVLSPDGRHFTYVVDNKLHVYDFDTKADVTVLPLPDLFDPKVSWSANSDRFTFIDRSPNFDFFARSYRLADGALDNLMTPDNTSVFAAVLSPDGKSLAAWGSFANGDFGIWKLDIASNTRVLLVPDTNQRIYGNTLAWSPDQSQIAYLRADFTDSATHLEVVNVSTGTTRTIDAMAAFGRVRWSPDGASLLFTSLRDGPPEQVWRYQLNDGTSTVLTQGPNDNYAPQWSPDGKAFAYYSFNENNETLPIIVRDLAGGASTIVENLSSQTDGIVLQWTPAGYLGFSLNEKVTRLALPGRFAVEGAPLEPGDNLFSATARDDSGNISAASAPILVNYSVADRPDLSLTQNDLVVMPAAPIAGEQARISVTIHNTGTLASPVAELSLLVVDAQGNSTGLLNGDILNPITAGSAQTVIADWTVPEGANGYTVVAVVDAFDQVAEVSESNNFASRDLIVPTDARPSISLSTDAKSYHAADVVKGALRIVNSGAAFNGLVEVVVEDAAGIRVQPLLTKALAGLAYGESVEETVSWNTGTTFAGNYQLHARLFDADGNLVADGTALFAITASTDLSASVSTDKASYTGNSAVRAMGVLNYRSGNTAVSGASLRLRILNGSASPLAETAQPLGDLLPNTSGNLVLDWNTAIYPPGLYEAKLEMIRDSQVLVQASTSFAIEAGGVQLSGALQLSESAPAAGATERVTYTVENKGNTAVSQQPIVISLVDPDLQAVLRSERMFVDVPVAGRADGTVSFTTVSLALKSYTISLQAETADTSGAPQLSTLQTAKFTLMDRTPPLVILKAPTENGFFSGGSKASVSALDDLSTIRSVEISVDGGAWFAAPIQNLAANLYGEILPTLAEGSHTLQARATDAFGNTGVTSMLTFIVDNTPPVVAISGVTNNGLYNQNVTATVTISDAFLQESAIALNGAPYVSGTPIITDGVYTLAVAATDAATNVTNVALHFEVDKTPPAAPTVTTPRDGATLNRRVTDIIGSSEPNATIALSIADQQFSAVTDLQGNFSFPQVALREGPNSFTVQAKDRAGNQGAITTVTLRVVTVTVELNGELKPAHGVLVWAPVRHDEDKHCHGHKAGHDAIDAGEDHAGREARHNECHIHEHDKDDEHDKNDKDGKHDKDDDADDKKAPTPDVLLQLLDATFLQAGLDYQIVHHEREFIAALRTRRHGALVLVDVHGNHEHDEDKRAPLKISKDAEREIRATVASGVGLTLIKTDPDHDAHWDDLVGAKAAGRLKHLKQVVLPDSVLGAAGQWDITGSGVRLKVQGGTAVGRLVPSNNAPAAVLNNHGQGRVVWLTFDPSDLTDATAAQAIVLNAVNHVLPLPPTVLLPGGVAQVRWTASKILPPMTLRLEESLAEGLSFLRLIDGELKTTQEGVFTRPVTSDKTSFDALIRLPMEKGDYAITGKLFGLEGDNATLLQDKQITLTLSANRDDLGAELMGLLTRLPAASGKDREKMQEATELVQKAIIRNQITRADAAYSIKRLVEAVEKLTKIHVDTHAIVTKLGKVLGTYQLLWASYP